MYLADEKRYDTMVYNRCGNSGSHILISPIIMVLLTEAQSATSERS